MVVASWGAYDYDGPRLPTPASSAPVDLDRGDQHSLRITAMADEFRHGYDHPSRLARCSALLDGDRLAPYTQLRQLRRRGS